MKLGFTDQLARLNSRPATEIDETVDRLRSEAAAAGRLRDYLNHPEVSALLVERTRDRVDIGLTWTIAIGLLYTTVNVQEFVSIGKGMDSVGWWAAWLVEPFITFGVLMLIRVDQVARRHRIVPGSWVRWTRRAAFATSYLFNTWLYWWPDVGEVQPSRVVLHSAIPILAFCFAEAVTDSRDALTTAALAASKGLGLIQETPKGEEPAVLVDEPVDDEGPEGGEPDTAPLPPRLPKGHLKEVVIPAAYRELADRARSEGRSLDTITLSSVDSLAGTNKYVTKEMIAPLREQVEREWTEEARDGVPV